MKRQLFETTKVFPYTHGSSFDRLGFLSMIFCIQVAAATLDATAKITLTHCDTADGTFTKVEDERIFLDKTTVDRDNKGHVVEAYTEIPVEAGDLLNVDVDLLGCEQYVKINVEYAGTVSASYAIALGDSNFDPPE